MTVFVRNVDIIISHIRGRHSTNVTYVLCAMIHVCHCRHQHLDNRAFSVCVCVCVCVCVYVCVCVIAGQNCLFPCNRIVYLSVVSCLILIAISLSG